MPQMFIFISIHSLLQHHPKMKDLVYRFIDKLPQYIGRITVNNENKNWDELLRSVHDLKGTSGNYGYPALASLAETMETHTLEKDKYKLILDFVELKATHQKIIRGLDASA